MTTKWKVLAVSNVQTHEVAAAPAPTTFGDVMESLGILPGELRVTHVTSRPRSSHMQLGSGMPHTYPRILSCLPDKVLNSSPTKSMKCVILMSIYSRIVPLKLISIKK